MLDILEQIGLVDGPVHFLSHFPRLHGSLCFVLAQRFQQHHEFIPAQPCQGIALAYTGSQTLAHFDQEQVADVVSPGVVQYLEIIQIDEQQRGTVVVTRTAGNRLVQTIKQQTAVGSWVSGS